MTIIKRTIAEKRLLAEKELKKIEQRLIKAPEGRLRSVNDGGTHKYFHVHPNGNPTGTYLSKQKDKKLIISLAQKTYDKKLKKELLAMNKSYNIIQTELDKISKIKDSFHVNELNREYIIPSIFDPAYAQTWQAVEYQGKAFTEKDPELYTDKNERVRSKSEKMIADKLNKMGIPYRYEYPLKLKNGYTVHPDFTMYSVRRQKVIIYEHFGKMGDLDYCEKNIRKINTYIKEGYVIGDNLIFTFETKDQVIDTKALDVLLSQVL